MLEPQSRTLLLDALKPPPERQLDFAVGTTFTLDLVALLAAPLAFALLDRSGPDGKVSADPIALLEARAWVLESHAAAIAEAQAGFFPAIERAVLTQTIADYQRLGCWTPHVEITRRAFDVAIDVFLHAGSITRRPRYEDAVATPPGA